MRLWLSALILHIAASYTDYPARETVVLRQWTRTFENGTSSIVDIPDAFLEREIVSYSSALPNLDSKALLKFTCSLVCTLYFDDAEIASSNNQYLPVFAEVPKGSRRVRIVVDSRFHGRHNMHQLQYDWWQPGGIFNPIELHLLRGEAFIRHIKVYPLAFPQVRLEADVTHQLRLAASFDGGEPSALADATTILSVPGARQWSPASPALHHVTVYLLDGNLIQDAITVRFGLRTVEAHTGRVHVNGGAVQLLGFNRHHFGQHGVIVSEEEIWTDLSHIKALGGNFMRGAHYPQDPRVLDACDELGIMVWEEATGWQNNVEELTNRTFVEMQKDEVRRMMQASANNPSVIIYGFLNEGMSVHPYSVGAYMELAQEVRAFDSTRLVGWASSMGIRDLAWEFADVVGFNDYTGWYRSNVDATVDDFQYVPQVWSYYHNWVVENFPGKPLIASEFGAGALQGKHGSGLKKWTEECQSYLIQLHLLGALQADVAGVAIWSLVDFPVDPTTDPAYRPHGRNDKGVLATDRSPKLAYKAVAAIFRGHRGLIIEDADMHLFKEGFM